MIVKKREEGVRGKGEGGREREKKGKGKGERGEYCEYGECEFREYG